MCPVPRSPALALALGRSPVLAALRYVVAVRVRLSRDSVTAGDDVDGHDEVIDVDAVRPLSQVVAEVLGRRYLPSIQGGMATWVLRSGRRGPALGIVAEQWTAPELLTDGTVAISAVGSELHFEYRAQIDPRTVADSLSSHTDFPDRHVL